MNNNVGYYGLAKYQPDLILDSYLHSVQYSIDENLRETPILKDTSIIQTLDLDFYCNYFSPIENKPLQLELNMVEYNHYCYARNNAFYTPYGMMVLLYDISSCTTGFILANDLLIPRNRKICFVDIGAQLSIDTNNINNSRNIYCAFFADFVIEHIFLSKIHKTLRDTTLCNIRMKSNPCPVIMKNFMIPNINRYPVYDIQLKDIMVFRNRLDYDMYMIALERYYTSGWKMMYKDISARVINHIIFFDNYYDRYKKKSNRRRRY